MSEISNIASNLELINVNIIYYVKLYDLNDHSNLLYNKVGRSINTYKRMKSYRNEFYVDTIRLFIVKDIVNTERRIHQLFKKNGYEITYGNEYYSNEYEEDEIIDIIREAIVSNKSRTKEELIEIDPKNLNNETMKNINKIKSVNEKYIINAFKHYASEHMKNEDNIPRINTLSKVIYNDVDLSNFIKRLRELNQRYPITDKESYEYKLISKINKILGYDIIEVKKINQYREDTVLYVHVICEFVSTHNGNLPDSNSKKTFDSNYVKTNFPEHKSIYEYYNITHQFYDYMRAVNNKNGTKVKYNDNTLLSPREYLLRFFKDNGYHRLYKMFTIDGVDTSREEASIYNKYLMLKAFKNKYKIKPSNCNDSKRIIYFDYTIEDAIEESKYKNHPIKGNVVLIYEKSLTAFIKNIFDNNTKFENLNLHDINYYKNLLYELSHDWFPKYAPIKQSKNKSVHKVFNNTIMTEVEDDNDDNEDDENGDGDDDNDNDNELDYKNERNDALLSSITKMKNNCKNRIQLIFNIYDSMKVLISGLNTFLNDRIIPRQFDIDKYEDFKFETNKDKKKELKYLEELYKTLFNLKTDIESYISDLNCLADFNDISSEDIERNGNKDIEFEEYIDVKKIIFSTVDLDKECPSLESFEIPHSFKLKNNTKSRDTNGPSGCIDKFTNEDITNIIKSWHKLNGPIKPSRCKICSYKGIIFNIGRLYISLTSSASKKKLYESILKDIPEINTLKPDYGYRPVSEQIIYGIDECIKKHLNFDKFNIYTNPNQQKSVSSLFSILKRMSHKSESKVFMLDLKDNTTFINKIKDILKEKYVDIINYNLHKIIKLKSAGEFAIEDCLVFFNK